MKVGRKACPLAARIKKIMQKDEDVGKISQATPILIGRAMELLLKKICEKTYEIASTRQAKTISSSHVKACVMSEETMDFLKDVVASAPDLAQEEAKPTQAKTKRRRTEDSVEQEGPASTSEKPKRGRPAGSGRKKKQQEGEGGEEDGEAPAPAPAPARRSRKKKEAPPPPEDEAANAIAEPGSVPEALLQQEAGSGEYAGPAMAAMQYEPMQYEPMQYEPMQYEPMQDDGGLACDGLGGSFAAIQAIQAAAAAATAAAAAADAAAGAAEYASCETATDVPAQEHMQAAAGGVAALRASEPGGLSSSSSLGKVSLRSKHPLSLRSNHPLALRKQAAAPGGAEAGACPLAEGQAVKLEPVAAKHEVKAEDVDADLHSSSSAAAAEQPSEAPCTQQQQQQQQPSEALEHAEPLPPAAPALVLPGHFPVASSVEYDDDYDG